jgi:hypothetical protein
MTRLSSDDLEVAWKIPATFDLQNDQQNECKRDSASAIARHQTAKRKRDSAQPSSNVSGDSTPADQL